MARSSKTERWRQAPGYSDYDVSTLGRLRSWKGDKCRLMKTRRGDDGYIRVTLQSSKGKKKVERVHLLVARAFLGPARGRIVLHKNGKEWIPRLDNLRYGTHLQNTDDKRKHGTDQGGERNSQSELIRKHVKQIYKLKGKYTQRAIAEMFGVSRQAVSDVHRGITWSKVTGAAREK